MTSAGIDLRTYLLVLQSAVAVSLDNFRKHCQLVYKGSMPSHGRYLAAS